MSCFAHFRHFFFQKKKKKFFFRNPLFLARGTIIRPEIEKKSKKNFFFRNPFFWIRNTRIRPEIKKKFFGIFEISEIFSKFFQNSLYRWKKKFFFRNRSKSRVDHFSTIFASRNEKKFFWIFSNFLEKYIKCSGIPAFFFFIRYKRLQYIFSVDYRVGWMGWIQVRVQCICCRIHEPIFQLTCLSNRVLEINIPKLARYFVISSVFWAYLIAEATCTYFFEAIECHEYSGNRSAAQLSENPVQRGQIPFPESYF